MMIVLPGTEFNRIMKGCAPALDKIGSRQVLQHIEISHDGSGIGYATALDGFVLNQIRFQCKGDAGRFLLHPGIKYTGDKHSDVTLSWDEQTVSVSDGETTITRRTKPLADLDREAILDNRMAKKQRYSIAVDHRLLSRALKACNNTDRVLVMEFAEKLDAVILRSQGSCSLVLPMRINDNGFTDKLASFYGKKYNTTEKERLTNDDRSNGSP